jgi:L-threonylcarbamoyladenylate synthase
VSGQLWKSSDSGPSQAAAVLSEGAVVGFPTDTVFGIGCCAHRGDAIARLGEIKGRPPSQPLILMASTAIEVLAFAVWTPAARTLAERFWPGPLTLILTATELGHGLGGAGTVGVRVPAHPVALELLRLAGPLATTSANRHGEEPVRDAAEALRVLPGLDGALADRLPPVRRPPSSILDLTRDVPVLIRQGRLSARELGVPFPADEAGSRRD